MGDYQKAVTNRSLRTIKTELEFLLDADVITQAQFNNISNNLPANGASRTNSSRGPVPATPTPEPPANQLANMNMQEPMNEKAGYYGNNNVHNPPPPAYPTPPPAPITTGPPALAQASAMYQYNAQDAGDLALMPNDRIQVTEYMNAEWWKGKNERTGQEGIFPRSYVRVEDQKGIVPVTPAGPPVQSNYGNMPLDVSQGAVSGKQSGEPGKGQEMGKKFGKKLGNAAIFGAGASIGGKIVNGIF